MPDSSARNQREVSAVGHHERRDRAPRFTVSGVQAHRRAEWLREKLSKLEDEEIDLQSRLDFLHKIESKTAEKSEMLQNRIVQRRAELDMLRDPMQRGVVLKRRQLTEAEAKVAEVQHCLDEMTSNYVRGKADIMSKLKARETVAAMYETQTKALGILEELRQQTPTGVAGMECLSWVAGTWWRKFISLVVLVDVMLEHQRLVHPGFPLRDEMDVFFLLYLVELIVNILFFRSAFFVGRGLHVCWNYVDILVVLAGAVRRILTMESNGHVLGVAYLLLFRMLRLVRVFKGFRILGWRDLGWVESGVFRFSMDVIIAVSCLFLVNLEFGSTVSFFETFAEDMISLVFAFEFAARLLLYGCKMLRHGDGVFFNWVAFVTTGNSFILGWIVLPVLLTIPHTTAERVSWIKVVLRLSQYPRLVRLGEVVQSMPSLNHLTGSIGYAMRKMTWVMLLTLFVLYSSSLVLATVAGNRELQGWLAEGTAQTLRDTFPGVSHTFYVLFQLLNGNLDPVDELVHRVPASELFVMVFVIIANWAILSILTAVVSDCMASTSRARAQELHNQYEAESKEREELGVAALFDSIDKDGDGRITAAEFREMLRNEVQLTEINHHTGLNRLDIEELFHLLSRRQRDERDPFIDRSDFMKFLASQETNAVSARPVIKIQRRLSHLQKWLAAALAREPFSTLRSSGGLSSQAEGKRRVPKDKPKKWACWLPRAPGLPEGPGVLAA